ncbi:MAG: hypothetical protein ACOZIN_16525 [Myxococcota bacterium]
MPSTIAQASRQLAPRSFWYQGLTRRAQKRPVDAWLIEQANLRGFFGAAVLPTGASIDPALALEEIVIGLLSPHAPMEGRALKLIVRLLQSGQLDTDRLRLLAKRERAEPMLHWLLTRIPPEERNPSIEKLRALFASPPRGYRPIQYDYDASRLIRRPATREQLWRARRS